MANYSLVIGSKFQPFSFERYLQPLQIYGQAYKEQEDALADLATKAATVESMTNAQTDPESYAAYQSYANALKAQANSLATEGLTPTSRRAMLDMRKRYAQEVIPIQDAYNRRKEQAKMQADILARDPTHLFARMASTTSLDDYRNNKNLDLTLENYSGALLAKQVSDEAAALSKAARNDPNVRTELRKLLPYQYETIRQNGFSPEDIKEAILRSPSASPILTSIVDRVMESSGIANWNYASPEEKQRIWDKALSAANQGLWSAVGQTQYGTVTDSYGMQSALEAQRHRHTMDEIKAKAGGADKTDAGGSGIRHWSMGTEAASKYLGVANELYKKMTKNGKLSTVYSNKYYTNPMKIYKEYMREAKKTTRTQTRYNARTGESYEVRTGSDYAAAAEAIKKKYGVKSILTEQEYNALKSLGYDSNSSLSDYNEMATRINRAGNSYSASSTNMADYGHIQDVIFPTMRRFYRDSNPGFLYEYTSRGRGRAVDFNDVVKFDDKGKPNVSVEDISYSIKSPDDLIFTVGGKDYYISPEGYGRDLYNIIQGYKNRYWNYLQTGEDKSQYQDMVTEAIRNEFDRFNKVRSNTDSNR